MAAYHRGYDSRHLQADCQEPGSAPEPYARQSSMGYLLLYCRPIVYRYFMQEWHRMHSGQITSTNNKHLLSLHTDRTLRLTDGHTIYFASEIAPIYSYVHNISTWSDILVNVDIQQSVGCFVTRHYQLIEACRQPEKTVKCMHNPQDYIMLYIIVTHNAARATAERKHSPERMYTKPTEIKLDKHSRKLLQ